MNVIDFPRRNEPLPQPPHPDQHDLGDGLEAAFDIHRMIVNTMRMEPLRENPDAIGPVLLFAMSHHFGPDLVLWAEMQFEAVYGIDPRGFINHLTAYQA